MPDSYNRIFYTIEYHNTIVGNVILNKAPSFEDILNRS